MLACKHGSITSAMSVASAGMQIREAREGELQALSVEKYLDALCVYFWAATSILTSIITFTLYALLGYRLTADVVFNSLAIFNVIIVPLNGFPWVRLSLGPARAAGGGCCVTGLELCHCHHLHPLQTSSLTFFNAVFPATAHSLSRAGDQWTHRGSCVRAAPAEVTSLLLPFVTRFRSFVHTV